MYFLDDHSYKSTPTTLSHDGADVSSASMLVLNDHSSGWNHIVPVLGFSGSKALIWVHFRIAKK